MSPFFQRKEQNILAQKVPDFAFEGDLPRLDALGGPKIFGTFSQSFLLYDFSGPGNTVGSFEVFRRHHAG